MEPKRYNFGYAGPFECEYGDYIRYEYYSDLLDRCKKLSAEYNSLAVSFGIICRDHDRLIEENNERAR